MTSLLVRLFIKDAENVTDRKVRGRYGRLSGITGIVCNLLLFATKLVAGWLTGSVAISADAFNNLSDAGSAIVTLLGFKLSEKPADPEHPFGHGRVEYLAGLMVAAAILYMGIELFRASLDKIFHPTELAFHWASVIILGVSIGVKLWLFLFNRKLGRRIGSTVMVATATDSLSDCISTAAVLLSLVFSVAFGISVDGYAGALVAIFVFYSGIKAGGETLQPLLGQPADPEFVERIREIVMRREEMLGIHDLIVHDYGPGRVMVSLHAELPCTMEIMVAHEMIDEIEAEIAKEMGCVVSIHMDPIAVNDPETLELKGLVEEQLTAIDDRLTIHDFRFVRGVNRNNLIFDILVPYDCAREDDGIAEELRERVMAVRPDCCLVMQIDHSYVGQIRK